MAKKRENKEEEYKVALSGRKIPVLTLDNKWHQLFTQTGSTKQIEVLTEKLNELIREQGRINNEIKDIKKVKKKLMDNIVASMNDVERFPENERKMEERKRLIEECNEKLEEYRDEGLTLPGEIDRVNYQLMLATMEVCYDKLKQNTKDINEISDWVVKTRIELKKKLLKKQEAEITNQNLYSYMHDIFGAEVLEIFDMEYQPEIKKQEKKAENKKK